MAAHSCCDDAARAPRARRRVTKLRRRRPSSSTSSSPLKAGRKQRQQAGGEHPGAPSRKRVEIRRKMESLGRLVVPAVVCGGGGGSAADRLDELLLHAAGYIMRLQMQVRLMQIMVHALNDPDD